MSKALTLFCRSFLFLAFASLLPAQVELPAEVARHGYADMIVVNGNVVSMDDRV
jgi:hypothetical protein